MYFFLYFTILQNMRNVYVCHPRAKTSCMPTLYVNYEVLAQCCAQNAPPVMKLTAEGKSGIPFSLITDHGPFLEDNGIDIELCRGRV